MYETNDIFIEEINKFLDSKQELKRLKDLADLKEIEKSPDYNQKIKREEASSIQVISETLLEALREETLEPVQPHQKIIEHQAPLKDHAELSDNPANNTWNIANYFRLKQLSLIELIKTSRRLMNRKQ